MIFDLQLGDKFPPLAPCPSDAPPAMRREFAELELLEQQYEALLLQDEKAAAAAAAADPVSDQMPSYPPSVLEQCLSNPLDTVIASVLDRSIP